MNGKKVYEKPQVQLLILQVKEELMSISTAMGGDEFPWLGEEETTDLNDHSSYQMPD